MTRDVYEWVDPFAAIAEAEYWQWRCDDTRREMVEVVSSMHESNARETSYLRHLIEGLHKSICAQAAAQPRPAIYITTNPGDRP